MSTIIYLVRHGEVDNPKHIEYMRLPGFGLTDYGKEQAQRVGKILRAKGIDRIYASPLLRTKETARLISDQKIPIRYSEAFLEADYKKWQGIPRNSRSEDDIRAYRKNPIRFSAILGESLPDIQKRAVEEIIRIIEKHPEEKIAIVTHAAIAITVRMFFENRSLMDFQKVTVNYASVTTITLDDKLKCKSIRYNEYVSQKKGALDINE